MLESNWLNLSKNTVRFDLILTQNHQKPSWLMASKTLSDQNANSADMKNWFRDFFIYILFVYFYISCYLLNSHVPKQFFIGATTKIPIKINHIHLH